MRIYVRLIRTGVVDVQFSPHPVGGGSTDLIQRAGIAETYPSGERKLALQIVQRWGGCGHFPMKMTNPKVLRDIFV